MGTSAKPALLAALGVALFSVLDAMMKVIASAYPLAQSTGMRYWAAAFTATALYAIVAGKWPTRDEILRSVPRTVANVTAGACFFVALSRLPLVDALVLSFLSPLFLALWGRVLGEPLKKITLAGLVVGLAGVYVVACARVGGRRGHVDMIGLLAALACATLYALSMVLTRGRSRADSVATLVLLPSVSGAILSTPWMLFAWKPVSPEHWKLVGCVGILATAGYVCLASAYRQSPAGTLGLTEYTGLIWGAVFGYFIFHEVPSAATVLGAVLIAAACLPAFHQEE